jgi:SAM-dependent methyltransferase
MNNQKSVFNAYSQYYDLLYQDKDYSGEADYIKTLLARHGVDQGSLLEFGSGTGKHGRILAELGFLVHGIEQSAEMVARSPQVGGFTCQQGDICRIQMGRYFDAVLSLFHVISYQVNSRNLQDVFIRAAEHLKPGGLFVFDFWYSPAVYSLRPEVRIKRMADKKIEIIRLAEPDIYPNKNQVDVNYTIFVRDLVSGEVQTTAETHPMRHFSLPEIDLLAVMSGFERIGVEEFLSGKSAGEDTWGVCVTLKRV